MDRTPLDLRGCASLHQEAKHKVNEARNLKWSPRINFRQFISKHLHYISAPYDPLIMRGFQRMTSTCERSAENEEFSIRHRRALQ